MRSSHEPAPDEDRVRGGESSNQIARSLGSIWGAFSGQRPKSTTVEIGRDVVTCVIEEGTEDARPDDDESSASPLSPIRFEYKATAAVTKVTGRRVVAFIPKRDKTTDVSTQTFVLDRPPERF
jgi:hypothetical protein